jgi:hypothetical protein
MGPTKSHETSASVAAGTGTDAVTPTPASATAQGHNASRRRFARLGLAAPVVMSLASRSVWGEVCTGSEHTSGNTSQHEECTTLTAPDGKGISGWQETPVEDYPPGATTTTTTTKPGGKLSKRSVTVTGAKPFNAIFTADLDDETPLNTVLAGGDRLKQNAVAAILDAMAETPGFPAPEHIVDLYNSTVVWAPGDPTPVQVLSYFQFLNGGK